MTAEQLWRDHIGDLSVADRCDLLDELTEVRTGAAAAHFGDAVEYLLLIHAGKVAPMPDVSAWE